MHRDNNSSKYLLYLLIVIFVFIAGFYSASIDIYDLFTRSGITNYSTLRTTNSSQRSIDTRLLGEVLDVIRSEYIDTSKIDDKKLVYGATSGLVKGIGDKYTNFLTPEEKQEYLSANKREFQGIGATLALENEFVVIESPIDGSPAQRAGLKPKDVILKVDGQSVQGKTPVEVATLIRGEAKTKVSITYYRPSTNKTVDIDIVREVINLNILETEKLEDGVILFKVYQFTDESVESFEKKWDEKISEIVNENPKGLIIDLRNNPGGFVDAVRYSLGEFLPNRTIVFMEEDKQGRRKEYSVQRTGRLLDIPLVVLVNEGSASASEIFAGAMQDSGRAKVIGTKTVGKGVEQKLIDLSDGSMLQVVFQKWLTPKGRNISPEEPITPDILQENSEKQVQEAVKLLR